MWLAGLGEGNESFAALSSKTVIPHEEVWDGSGTHPRMCSAILFSGSRSTCFQSPYFPPEVQSHSVCQDCNPGHRSPLWPKLEIQFHRNIPIPILGVAAYPHQRHWVLCPVARASCRFSCHSQRVTAHSLGSLGWSLLLGPASICWEFHPHTEASGRWSYCIVPLRKNKTLCQQTKSMDKTQHILPRFLVKV